MPPTIAAIAEPGTPSPRRSAERLLAERQPGVGEPAEDREGREPAAGVGRERVAERPSAASAARASARSASRRRRRPRTDPSADERPALAEARPDDPRGEDPGSDERGERRDAERRVDGA